jgi:CRISPR-associated protein Cmr4
MIKHSKMMFLIAETPLHAGSGGDSVGIVDLPIQRERHTNFPKIEASGLKGCIREAFENSNKIISINGQNINVNNKDIISLIFGPEPENGNNNDHASSIFFTDARILLFPVKSLKGVFAWITCPMVLERFREELKLLKLNNINFDYNFNLLKNTAPTNSDILIKESNEVVLEEYTFKIEPKNDTSNIAKFLAEKIFPRPQNQQANNDIYLFWREKLENNLVILSDDDFKQFVTTSTEVITRIMIDNTTGVVKEGALWTEEYLPQDSILYSIVMASPLRVKDENKGIFKGNNDNEEAKNVIEFFEKGLPEIIQIGGNQTLGKGLTRTQILK